MSAPPPPPLPHRSPLSNQAARARRAPSPPQPGSLARALGPHLCLRGDARRFVGRHGRGGPQLGGGETLSALARPGCKPAERFGVGEEAREHPRAPFGLSPPPFASSLGLSPWGSLPSLRLLPGLSALFTLSSLTPRTCYLPPHPHPPHPLSPCCALQAQREGHDRASACEASSLPRPRVLDVPPRAGGGGREARLARPPLMRKGKRCSPSPYLSTGAQFFLLLEGAPNAAPRPARLAGDPGPPSRLLPT